MKAMSLRELVVLFDTQLQQLTLANLVSGFFPTYTLVVSLATTIVCASLALGTSAATASSPKLFSSFASFAAICIIGTMTTTLFYRLTGGRFTYSFRSTGNVVDWLVDAISRPLAEDTAVMLLSPSKRRERAFFFFGLCVLTEVGKVLSFWSLCTLLSLVWLGCSVHRACVRACVCVWAAHPKLKRFIREFINACIMVFMSKPLPLHVELLFSPFIIALWTFERAVCFAPLVISEEEKKKKR